MSENEFGLPQVDETVEENADESAEVSGQADPEKEMTVEELKAELAKTRREAAKRRVSKNEVEQKLAEYEEWKLSQMSEVDRLKAEKAETEEELRKYRVEKLQDKVAKKAGLDPDLADRIKGNTEAEMLADARVLAAKAPLKGASPTARELRPGIQGNPVGTETATDGNTWLRDALKGR